MSGSNLLMNFPNKDSARHDTLTNRNVSFQHVLQSIYRETDGEDLANILAGLQEQYTSLKWEVFKIDTDGTTTLDLTKFEYNPARDELIVTLCGLDVYAGTDNDYVKTSPTQLTFNYPLQKGFDVLVILGGTITSESFGNDLYTYVNQFKQLTDVPNTYHSKAGKYVKVNDTETGLVFDSAITTTNLTKLEYTVSISGDSSSEFYIPFVNKGIIKGIKVTKTVPTGVFNLSIWTILNGCWVYYSGDVDTVLWDIMDIPFVDESGSNNIYSKLDNQGPDDTFTIQIFVIE
jgi:hypothetical protein